MKKITSLLLTLSLLLCCALGARAEARSAQEIIEELVVDYGSYGDEAEAQIQALLKELAAADADAAARWESILALWKSAQTELTVNCEVPEGLCETDELCFVVLGFQLAPDGSMREELIERLTVALRCAERYPNALVLCTGGGTAAEDETATEAGRMAAWLLEHGVAEDRVLVEDKSLTTAQNAIRSFDILESQYPQVKELVIVSSDYHIATGALLFGAEAILRAETAGDETAQVVSNAAWQAPSGALPPMFQAGALIELAGDVETAFAIYYDTYDIHELPPLTSASESPAALDYADAANWAYFETDEERAVDVFLICPTVDTRSEANALDLNDKLKARFLSALDLERGIFEETGRLFSPYYRQMSINAYTLSDSEREEAKKLAFADVSAAFRWYLDNENGGRGIILAGFSQGGEMCLELLKAYYGGESAEAQALREHLVAVYSIGWMVTEEMTEAYPQIVPASGETDTGTVVCFDCEDGSVEETIIIPAGMKALSINPLNWKTDGTPADKTLNHGAVLEAGGEPIPALCGAAIGARGELIVTDVTAADYPPGLDIFPEGAYHLYDYMFFFTNLKENVAARTAAWLSRQDGLGTPEAICARGVLRVGTAGDYQPMSYLDAESGQYVGFDAALAEDLAAELGVELEYVPTSWPTLMVDTLAGSFDLAICGITITEARQEQALMSVGYLGNGKTLLCRAEDADRYTSLEAINRLEVRVMENPGGLNEKFARENLPDATLIIHDVNQEIPGLVAAGEADVMITEIMEAGYYVGQDSRLAAPLIYEPFTRGELGVLLPKGSEALLDYVNAFLEKEKASGRIDELAEEYIYRYITVEEELPSAA